jgi:NADH dehydrogenase (ubiquinone) Fe-S protein 1
MGTTGRGGGTEVGTYIKALLASEVSGNVVDLCPVGYVTQKQYNFAQ